jgi:hypothetical protein
MMAKCSRSVKTRTSSVGLGLATAGFRLWFVYHVDQLRQSFLSGAVCKCGTHKALDFSTLRFGTRRSKVQILSPRPLSSSLSRFAFRLSLACFSLVFLGAVFGFFSIPEPTLIVCMFSSFISTLAGLPGRFYPTRKNQITIDTNANSSFFIATRSHPLKRGCFSFAVRAAFHILRRQT